MINKIVIATTNAHKVAEIRAMLPQMEIITAQAAGFDQDVAETGATFSDNAFLKARAVCQAVNLPTLADDSGLCVDALNGAPGVYSARYSGGSKADNRRLLLKNLQGQTDRNAHFTCAMALVLPDGREFSAEGQTHGTILTAARGTSGFSYDSLFYSTDLQKSFAEATPAEKNAVSHRRRALTQIAEILKQL